ncbi:hypothetical protein GH714_041563 [Hevea brasiliensis]|uniref:Uncharacterized protein n=1 Tax=Hevea brasiliensis TaxID=3981 RepID=A0A6A6MQQ7_HEVBR|nr:hypothetical protein GH714_041563 [Hevea brasiliensis]
MGKQLKGQHSRMGERVLHLVETCGRDWRALEGFEHWGTAWAWTVVEDSRVLHIVQPRTLSKRRDLSAAQANLEFSTKISSTTNIRFLGENQSQLSIGGNPTIHFRQLLHHILRRRGARGSNKRGHGNSRDPSHIREEMGDLDMWLAKVELHIADGEEKLNEIDNWIEELDRRLDEFREEAKGTMNAAIDNLTSEGKSIRHALIEDIATLREENCFRREDLDHVLARLRDLDDEMVIMKR